MIAKLKPCLTRLWQSKVWDTGIMGLVALIALVYIIRIWNGKEPVTMTILLSQWLFACTWWGKILWDYHHSD